MSERLPEEWLEEYQDGRASPLGRALRSTFDAENHDTLGKDVTGLMIDLSKVPYGDEDQAPVARAPPPARPAEAHHADRPPARGTYPSLFAWIGDLFGRRTV